MSRHEVIHEDKGLAFGDDHATGEFLMIWTRPTDLAKRASQDNFGPDPEEVIVDEDVLFTSLTREKMESLVVEHGFTMLELEHAHTDSQRYDQ